MKLIIGLGNPGKKYENTRHNTGFLALDQVIERYKVHEVVKFEMEKKFNAEIVKIKVGEEDIVLVKPQTFMNLSGEAVKKVVDFYKINPEADLIVLHDDIDIELGKVRIKNKGSSAGHNGVQSIIDSLGADNFVRIRIGIGRPESCPIGIDDYVTGNFSAEEKEKVLKAIGTVIVGGLSSL